MAEWQMAMDVKGKRVLVVGLGKSGVASAQFLAARGARVTVSDTRSQSELKNQIPALLDRGIAVETGGHGERTFRDQDLIVVSPGVPSDIPQLVRARAQGIPVIGEIELATRFLKGKIVAITGSNGKTTTTTLCGELIASASQRTLIGGNIGTPVILLVDDSTDDTVNVIEVSSFQLETIQTFHPSIAVVLNITPDHLDRHGSMEAYTAAKARIFENQTVSDYSVLNLDDPGSAGLETRTKAQLCWFTRKRELSGEQVGAFVRGGEIYWRDFKREDKIMPVSEIPLKGAHNLENVLAAVSVGRLCGSDGTSIRDAVRKFKAVDHRLQHIATVAGVEYYNDSKATNVDATIKAIESFPGNIHLILGGKDKDSDYTLMNNLLRERVKRVYTIGAAAEKIRSHVQSAVEVLPCKTLDNAVERARDLAKVGDVVLLAPACSSFDQFENYEHRGRTFRTLVEQFASPATAGQERR
ncbi:MAG TPA: UDP-N-acetylmuramoyl-L-alanine--D-glutamate ligase [Terriglobales bacterium]|nr:UDP-N-acetylmuramoyl-L-alanine--D-glutamate ligase [Terriglobales bacterium]